MQLERQIEQIFAHRADNMSFLNREWTLYMNACHLAYNCSCEVAIIINTPQNPLRSFCTMDIQTMLHTILATREKISL